jgi:phosphomannomutase/phosphoglucomutase
MTLALMLDLLATSERSLAEEIDNLPPSFTTKDKVACLAQKVPVLITALKEEFPNADTSDGIKIIIDPKNWIMIRPSGTEPIVRVYAEAESQEKLDALMSEYLEKVNSIISR